MANGWLERELEDYVVANLPTFFVNLRQEKSVQDFNSNFEVGVIGRQVKCRFGIIDLLVYSTYKSSPIPIYTVTLLEFKAVQADKKTVEQVNRYMAALNEVGIYDAVPDEDFFDYAHVVDSYISFESMIVAPSFSEAIKWYPNRVLAKKHEQGFSFDFDPGIKGTRHDNSELQATLMPLIRRATESARQWHMTQKLQRGLDSTDRNIESN